MIQKGVSSSTQPDIKESIKILTDEDRMSILVRLSNGTHSVSELADALEIEPSATSHKLKDLRDGCLVQMQRVKKMHFYALTKFVSVQEVKDAPGSLELTIRNDFGEHLTLRLSRN